jgi:hypothetical protein
MGASRTDATADESVHDAGEANTIDNFGRVFDRKLEELVIGRMERNSNQVVRFLDNPEIREVVTRLMRNQVYSSIRNEAFEWRYRRLREGDRTCSIRPKIWWVRSVWGRTPFWN